MPRPTLPNEVKKLDMFEVLLTQHTEEQLWDFYASKIETINYLYDVINSAKNRWLEKVLDKDPYEKHDWRKGKPSRLDKTDWTRYLTEEDMDKYHSTRSYLRDLFICDRAFKWSETKPDFNDMVWQTERFNSMANDNDEFAVYESWRFNQSKMHWEKTDAEWIEEQKQIGYHQTHHKPRGWKEAHWDSLSEENKKWNIEREIDCEYHEDCKFCVREQEVIDRRERELKEYEEREEQRIKESNERWRKECEEKQEAKRCILKETHTCELCNFTTTSSYVWDEHLESKSHIKLKNMKEWYCSACEIQCRSLPEWTAHLTTKKHKYAIGEVEKQTEYVCVKCNYTTHHKQNYEKHLTTKAHMEKV